MKRLFWFTMGAIAGVWAYRYLREQGGEIPGMQTLTERGRSLTSRGREFAESGRQLADESRQFAQAARDTAQAAMDTAQSRGREVADKVRTRSGPMASHSTEGNSSSAHRRREDVTEPQTG